MAHGIFASNCSAFSGSGAPPEELVVCDDGSTDETQAIVDRFAANAALPIRVYRNEKNLRTTKNFERAIGLCEGDVIVTADQDDVWYSDKLAKIEDVFATGDVGLVFSDADLIDGDGRPRHKRLWHEVRFSPRRLASLQRGNAFSTLLRRPTVTGATMAFRAELRELVLPISDLWVHDDWISLLIAAGNRVVAIEQPLMQYRLHDDNQLGVGDGALTVQSAAKSIARKSFLVRAEQFLKLREALARRHPLQEDRLAQIDGKILHFQARAELPESRLARLPYVVLELARLRYTRYSGTTLAFLRDLASRS